MAPLVPVTEDDVKRSVTEVFPWELRSDPAPESPYATNAGTKSNMGANTDTPTTALGLYAQPWYEAVLAWEPWLRSVHGSAGTVRLRLFHVRHLADVMPERPEAITTEALVKVLGMFDWKPSTRKSYVASLRSFFRWLQASGRRADNPGAALPSVSVPRGVPRPAPVSVIDAALARARAAGDSRMYLTLLLAAESGLRRGELARVHSQDVHEEEGEYWLWVTGKGGHVRSVPIEADVAKGLRFVGGYLWESAFKRGHHVTADHVGRMLTRALGSANPHALRHRAATDALAATGNVAAVQKFLGHSKPETTMIYADVADDAVRAAARGARRQR